MRFQVDNLSSFEQLYRYQMRMSIAPLVRALGPLAICDEKRTRPVVKRIAVHVSLDLSSGCWFSVVMVLPSASISIRPWGFYNKAVGSICCCG